MDAAGCVESDLDEGFARNRSGEFAQFIRYALASLAEARRRLNDGVDRKYFSTAEIQSAQALGQRSQDAARNLHLSLEPFLKRPLQKPRRRR